jgi:hypothetical protein
MLFGAAAGIAIGAASIGFFLVAISLVINLQADAASSLLQHPLFKAGSELIMSSLFLALPLFAIWKTWRGQ